MQKIQKSESCVLIVDLSWDDKDVVPEKVTPEVEFLFRRMTEVTLEEADIGAGELVLDIGCGRGLDCVRMAEKDAVVIGLEPSSVMLGHAAKYVARSCTKIFLMRGIGEDLPFRASSIDKVVCKGAIDHFVDPMKALTEMARVLKRGGQAIIAVANFGSLGFKLGKSIYYVLKRLDTNRKDFRMPWEMPSDHTYKFDYWVLMRMLKQYFVVEKVSGVSLLFGLPWWGGFLARCPRKLSEAILVLLDRIARCLPIFSDVIVVRCAPLVSF